MNEHGAVNCNTLHTSDTTASKHFYGEVFGWTTFSLGGAEFWALPGYGDHLETISPGIRERTAEMGVAGFEDVVAVLDQLQDGDKLHWDVTFRGRRCRRDLCCCRRTPRHGRDLSDRRRVRSAHGVACSRRRDLYGQPVRGRNR